MANILVCDDEKNLLEMLSMALTQEGHKVKTASDGVEAFRILESAALDLVITDLKLPDISGLDILHRAKSLDQSRPVILITAFASTETAVTAMKEGAFDYLEKPFRMEDLFLVVTRALEQMALKKENRQLKKALKSKESVRVSVIGNSPAMRRTLELVKRVSRTEATILITGESGTGKELIAQAIHEESPRKEAAFVPVNCGAIPENLIESELFGHSKGAFSGAVSQRKGVFVEADGGTLFLDEIGEMPLSAQVKLLRVLQEQTVRPVGGTGERKIDVRVLAATNRNLAEEVAEERFREDLYYRINVINLHLPPLRERGEDIPLLVARFIEKSASRYGLSIKHIEPPALDALLRYRFPGNIRELENLIEGAVALATGDSLKLSNLPEHIRRGKSSDHSLVNAVTEELKPEEFTGVSEISSSAKKELFPESGVDLDNVLAETEQRLIQQALEKSGGNKTKAAGMLGLSFRSFRYRLAKLKKSLE
ncbi:sigma-54-dependent transcriptional regulator [Magnetococcales bacterium HHB-1]